MIAALGGPGEVLLRERAILAAARPWLVSFDGDALNRDPRGRFIGRAGVRGELYRRGGPPFPALEAMLAAVGAAPARALAVVGRDGRVKRRRRSRLLGETVIRVLALHLLSRAGGGRLSRIEAHDLFESEFGLKLPVEWQHELGRVRRQLVDDFGPLPGPGAG